MASRVRFAPPRIPIVSNLTGRWVQDDTLGSARYWRQHIREAVRFADGVEALHAHGIGAFVELGPEPTLLGLVRQSSKGPSSLRVPSMKSGVDETQCLLSALGDLFKAGTTVDWLGFSRGFEGRKVAMPTYPFERKRHWLDEEELSTHEETAAVDVGPVASPTSLLGRQVASPLADRQYANRIGVAAWPFLADHKVFDTPIMPPKHSNARPSCPEARCAT
jgi:acyl transferase domain-containing protein